jgi:hypothetical protein
MAEDELPLPIACPEPGNKLLSLPSPRLFILVFLAHGISGVWALGLKTPVSKSLTIVKKCAFSH